MRNRFALPLVAAAATAFWACSSSSSGSNSTNDGGTSSSSSGSGSSSSSSSSGSSTSGSSGSSSSSGASSSGGSNSSSGGSMACDSGATADGGFSFASVCGTTLLKSLTAAQTVQLCDETIAYFGSTLSAPVFCKWGGLQSASSSSPMSDSDVQMQCATAQSTCEGSTLTDDAGSPSYFLWGIQTTGDIPSVANCFDGPINSSCTATVAQYAACISDESTAFISAVNTFPACGTLTLAETMNVNTEQGMTPASCTTLMNDCAGLSPPDPLNF